MLCLPSIKITKNLLEQSLSLSLYDVRTMAQKEVNRQ